MTDYFPKVGVWQVPEVAFRASAIEMSRDGAEGNEGIALWLGHRDQTATVSQLVLLRGPGVRRLPFQITISPALIDLVTEYAVDEGLTLVGQVHSHGPLSSIDLSPTDRRYGFAVPDFLSVVAPNFAMDSELTLHECGIHVYEAPDGWRRLGDDEARQRLHVGSGDLAKVVTIGAVEP